jgi:hypothetical protein
MNPSEWLRREMEAVLNQPMFHTTACLERNIDAFCDDKPNPGCTCGRTERIKNDR